MSAGLILVDIQNDYFEGGRMELVGMESAAGNAAKVLWKFRSAGAPVFHVRHISKRPGATFFLPGTMGAEIHEGVMPQDGEPVVEKHYPNAFRETKLLEMLRRAQLSSVVLCGAMSHMCIDATARAAFDHGFRCILVDDACATRNVSHRGRVVAAEDVHVAFMGALSGIYAELVSADQLRI